MTAAIAAWLNTYAPYLLAAFFVGRWMGYREGGRDGEICGRQQERIETLKRELADKGYR